MEVGGSDTRPSGIPSASNPNPDSFDRQLPRDFLDRPPTHRDGHVMATAALLNPSTNYSHHAAFVSGYSHHAGPGPSMNVPGMITPAESRRPSDEPEMASQRQSLPSIKEVISGTKPPSLPPPPSTISGPPSLPSPFASSALPPRSYADGLQDRHSPRPLHPPTSYPPRPDSIHASDPSRPAPLSGRPPPPPGLPSFPPPSSGVKLESPHDSEQRQSESHHINGGYLHPLPPHVAQLPYQAQPPPPPPGHMPQGQLPLTGYPVSPRHGGPSLPTPYEAGRPGHPDEGEFGRGRNTYEQTFNRQYEAWTYGDALGKIAAASRTIYNFAEAYGRASQEEHGAGAHPPSRLPSERIIADIMVSVDWIHTMLDNLRGLVQQNNAANDRVREGSRPKIAYEEEDVPMYNDGMKAGYTIQELKKRRGRAAPPGRCHSCNRIDTPEWRRGPDGARTLCNACGLHYAKLERKRQMEQRAIRPKPSDEQR